MTGIIAYRSAPELDAVEFTFIVPLYRRHRREFLIKPTKLKSFKPREGDNPLLKMLADAVSAAVGQPVQMRVRLYKVRFEVVTKKANASQVPATLTDIDEVVDEICSPRERQLPEPVYSEVKDLTR